MDRADALTDVTFSRRVRWLDLLPNLHFVYLSREDLLGQAISSARALQTGQYRSTQRVKQVAIYNPDLIRSQLVAIVRERGQWEAFFARTGIEPLRIIYERFLEDRLTHVRLVADLMGVENPVIDERRIDLAIQCDAVTEEWRQRFRFENGDPNLLDDLFPTGLSLIRKVYLRFWSLAHRNLHS
jgi:LPS sulfotransferase NodH